MDTQPAGKSFLDCFSLQVSSCDVFRKFEFFSNGRVLLFDRFVAFAAVNTNFRTNNTFKGYVGTIKLGIVSASGEIVNESSVNAGLRRLECFQKNFMIDDFIEQQTLMLEAANLMPNNVLTLSIEVEYFDIN